MDFFILSVRAPEMQIMRLFYMSTHLKHYTLVHIIARIIVACSKLLLQYLPYRIEQWDWSHAAWFRLLALFKLTVEFSKVKMMTTEQQLAGSWFWKHPYSFFLEKSMKFLELECVSGSMCLPHGGGTWTAAVTRNCKLSKQFQVRNSGKIGNPQAQF